jgi:Mg2+ and Co2+ transporter CorA
MEDRLDNLKRRLQHLLLYFYDSEVDVLWNRMKDIERDLYELEDDIVKKEGKN